MKEKEWEIMHEVRLALSRMDIEAVEKPPEPENFRAELLAKITQRISYWLDHDFEHLLRLMYHIDVGENAFKEALSFPNPASQLAKLVWERELQKAKTRILYRNNKL